MLVVEVMEENERTGGNGGYLREKDTLRSLTKHYLNCFVCTTTTVTDSGL